MKRYTEYKDSGVPWIGEIPRDWDLNKIKYSTYVKGRIGWQGLKSDEFIDEGPYLVTGTDLINGKINWDTCYHISEERYNEAPQIQLENGDLLITKDGTIGKISIVSNKPDKAILNSGLFVTRPLCNIYITKFMYWILNSKVFWSYFEYLETGSTIKHLYQETFENFSFPVPNIQTQHSIADYLDRKTAAIDTLISDKQKMIDLLKEKRQAIISEAVTKGLDKNVQMKDSGIEWIGEIPEHWEVKKLSYIAKTISGGTPSRDKIEYWKNGTIPWMSSGEINNEFISNTKEFITALGMQNSNAKILPKHTVMMALNGQGKTKGKTAILEIETTCNQSLVGFVCDDREVEYKFLFYVFKTIYKYIRSLVGDESREGLSVSFLRQQRIAVPSISEQQKIIQYLDSITYNIEDIIRDVDLQIEKLKEYRQAIISEAVTGKVAI